MEGAQTALAIRDYPVALREADDVESRIRRFGAQIFRAIGREQPSAFNKNYWLGRIMEWSMTKPEFKLNLFRLVDVLPTLKSSRAIAEHVSEYLGKVGAEINGLLGWGLNVPPTSLRAKLMAVAVKRGVSQMASQFIAGEGPKEALKELRAMRKNGLAFTVDLLGEFSVSEREAKVYLDRYMDALTVFGREIPRWKEARPILAGHPGDASAVCVSVKLSALYSQTSCLNFARSVDVLSEKLTTLARKAREVNGSLYVDAEDFGNNPIIYATFKRVFGSEEFRDFPYPGIVLQAYAKESYALAENLLDFARTRGGPIAIRLVKGAYWDYETITCAQQGWESPLYKRKESSDANFERITQLLLDNTDVCLPAFGSHNIRSLSHACCYAEHRGIPHTSFELQMLHGMAEPIARAFARQGYLVRMYVPLGEMLPGMGYLVRRLLENTSNESFLRHTFFDSNDTDELLRRPELTE